MNTARVFVVNEPVLHRDGETTRHLDLSDAERFGRVLHLTPPGTPLTDPEALVSAFSRSLDDFGPDDYLLAVGNPAMIAWAAALASRRTGGRLKILVWGGRGENARYRSTEVELWREGAAA